MVTLLSVQTAVLLPSEPFRAGQFSLYTLSWFQLYVAAVTAALTVFWQWFPYSRRNLGLLVAGISVAALPLLVPLRQGSRWVFSEVEKLDLIMEARSVARVVWLEGGWGLTQLYSGLLWALPAVMLGAAWFLFKTADPSRRFFLATVLCGGFLLLQQLRLHYFGSFALFLPWLLLLAGPWERYASGRRAITLLSLTLITVAAYAPTWDRLMHRPGPARDREYDVVRRIYPYFADRCRTLPGIVLADPNDGHHITFHTDCSVVANMMIITPQHERKVRLVDRLMALPLAEVRTAAPYVRYIFVWDDRPFWAPGLRQDTPRSGPLTGEILGLPLPPPEGLRIVAELELPGTEGQVYARLVELLQ